MNKERYKELIEEVVPKEDKFKNGLIAFVIGGLVGLLGQIMVTILENNFDVAHKDATSIMIVILIFIASFCTALGFFDKLVSKLKCGLLIPITGFAHSMTSATLDYRKEGPISGFGSNMFKLAGSVILYGVVSAWFFGMIRYLLGGKI